MAIDKEELLRKRLAAREYDIEGVGVVRLRALTRAEVHEMRAGADGPSDELERRMVSAAMVDPALTPDEVRQWQENSPAGELEPLTHEIMRLSGMAKGAPKEAMAQFRE